MTTSREELALSILRKIVSENCKSMGPHYEDVDPAEAATWGGGCVIDTNVHLTEDEWRLWFAYEAEHRDVGP